MPSTYDSSNRRLSILADAVELWQHRDLLILLISRNIKTRYKRSVLGVAWTMLNPLLTMLVLTLVFSSLFQPTITHYPIYLLAGLLLWNFVAQTTTSAMNGMVWNSGLLKRVYIPRSIFAVSAVGTGLVNLCLALIPLGAVMFLSGVSLTPAIFFLPIAVLMATAFTLGLAMLLSTFAVFYADVIDMYQIVLTAWMYLTPIFYPASILPPNVSWIIRLNPMTYLIECFRLPVFLGQFPSLSTALTAGAAALFSLVLGWLAFSRKADEFAYRI